jgi:hypothetical protein
MQIFILHVRHRISRSFHQYGGSRRRMPCASTTERKNRFWGIRPGQSSGTGPCSTWPLPNGNCCARRSASRRIQPTERGHSSRPQGCRQHRACHLHRRSHFGDRHRCLRPKSFRQAVHLNARVSAAQATEKFGIDLTFQLFAVFDFQFYDLSIVFNQCCAQIIGSNDVQAVIP